MEFDSLAQLCAACLVYAAGVNPCPREVVISTGNLACLHNLLISSFEYGRVGTRGRNHLLVGDLIGRWTPCMRQNGVPLIRAGKRVKSEGSSVNEYHFVYQ